MPLPLPQRTAPRFASEPQSTSVLESPSSSLLDSILDQTVSGLLSNVIDATTAPPKPVERKKVRIEIKTRRFVLCGICKLSDCRRSHWVEDTTWEIHYV